MTPKGRPGQRQRRSPEPRAALRGVFGLLTLGIVGLGWLPACTVVGPDYVPPETQMPDAWHQSLTRGLAEGHADLQTWWGALSDPVLTGLIERAGKANLDLKEAAARVREARAVRAIAAGERYPDVDAAGTAQRTRVSEETVPVLPPGLDRSDNLFQAGFDASWEIDVWGRIARSVESADAGLQASVEDYRDVLVLLYAEVALSYVDARSLQTRIRFAEANVETQRETLKLTR
ncbi:MAG: TolC family protein, partial [Planctomycetota bacterium]